MKGVVKTYLPEKRYGFIKGDDGKDYFFHRNEFRDNAHLDKICEEAHVSFDQQVTPKGYQAKNCLLINPQFISTYVVPDQFLTSKTDKIRGWEVVEYGEWVVHGSSNDSPDAAKKNIIENASSIGANALMFFEYYKTTGSEPGTGDGTYYFTIHNFCGRIAFVAKKYSNGKYKQEDLLGMNQYAKSVKEKFIEKMESEKKILRGKKQRDVILMVLFGALAVFLQKGDLAEYSAGIAMVFFALVMARFIIGIFSDKKEYGAWLEKCESSQVESN